MNISKFTIFFLFVLLFATNEFIYAQDGVCRITANSIDYLPHSVIVSDATLLREDNLNFQDAAFSEQFQHKEFGINVFASVVKIASPLFDKRPTVLRFTLQLSGETNDLHNFYTSSADSIYDKNWKGLSISNEVKIGDYKGYNFTLTCEKRKKRGDK